MSRRRHVVRSRSCLMRSPSSKTDNDKVPIFSRYNGRATGTGQTGIKRGEGGRRKNAGEEANNANVIKRNANIVVFPLFYYSLCNAEFAPRVSRKSALAAGLNRAPPLTAAQRNVNAIKVDVLLSFVAF